MLRRANLNNADEAFYIFGFRVNLLSVQLYILNAEQTAYP
jgi:hypothetical protein